MAKAKDKSKQTIDTKVVEVKVDTVTVPSNVPISNEVQSKKKPGRPSNGNSKYTEEDREKFKGPNYHKYLGVRDKLVELLDGTRTAREVVEDVDISQPTFFKYKALAQLDSGLRLMTKEESIHLKKNAIAGNHYDPRKKSQIK